MNDFAVYGSSNIGGLKSFKFVPVVDVVTVPLPDAAGYKISHPVVLDAGKQWYDGYATFNMLSFSEKQGMGKQGVFYHVEVKGSYPKDGQGMGDLFDQMEGQEFLLDVVDNNGVRRLIAGNRKNVFGRYVGCSFNSAFDTKSAIPGKNGFDYVFSGDFMGKAFFYAP